jgi:ribosomal protein S18 acetylase RimI-like enzyme
MQPGVLIASGNGLSYRRITDETDSAIPEFLETYRHSFAGAPYFEVYDDEFIMNEVVRPHLSNWLCVAELSGKVVGLACAHPLVGGQHPEILAYLQQEQVPFPLDAAIYLSELAVRSSARGMGIGSMLARLTYGEAAKNGFSFYVTRTAAVGSNSLRIFKQLGGIELPFIQPFEGGVPSSSSSRVWLYGLTSTHAIP